MTEARIVCGAMMTMLAGGCAASVRSHDTTSNAPRASTASSAPHVARVAGHGEVPLEDLRAHMAAGDAHALAFADITLAGADGAHEMTGEAAADERVERAVVVGHPDDEAALLVVTTCGNATLVSGHWDGQHWQPVNRVPLMRDLHPGRCGTTTVRAEPLRLSSDVAREVAVVVVSQDATGESVQGPFLSVFQLAGDGRIGTLMSHVPFGSMDDETGATTQGEFLVVDDVPAPRDLHVSIRPGRPGPGGAPVQEIVRRRYALRGPHLELVEEHSEEAQ